MHDDVDPSSVGTHCYSLFHHSMKKPYIHLLHRVFCHAKEDKTLRETSPLVVCKSLLMLFPLPVLHVDPLSFVDLKYNQLIQRYN